jgi:hypothetical protein
MKDNATYWCGNTEIFPTEQQKQTHKALQTAAEKMGLNNFKAQLAQHIKTGKSKKSFRFTVTAEQAIVIATMPKVLSGEITPNDAMALLWQYDVMHQRIAN